MATGEDQERQQAGESGREARKKGFATVSRMDRRSRKEGPDDLEFSEEDEAITESEEEPSDSEAESLATVVVVEKTVTWGSMTTIEPDGTECESADLSDEENGKAHRAKFK